MNWEIGIDIYPLLCVKWGFPSASDRKESACIMGDLGLIPGSGRSWGREWQPTPVFLPGESLGQKSVVVYSLWGRRE